MYVLTANRPTTAYPQKLAADGVPAKHRLIMANYYANQPLFELLARLGWLLV